MYKRQGKLLTGRDLTDEQRYLLGKLSRYNAYLHGYGIACGLEVGQHPNPACRSELVVVSPGLAIDCCGHEILPVSYTHLDVYKRQPPPSSRPRAAR